LSQSESSPLLMYFSYFLPNDKARAFYNDSSAPAPLMFGLNPLRLMHF
jgi:hypothetical protein